MYMKHSKEHVFSYILMLCLLSPGVTTAAVVVLTGLGVVLCMAGLALLGCTKIQIQISVSLLISPMKKKNNDNFCFNLTN